MQESELTVAFVLETAGNKNKIYLAEMADEAVTLALPDYSLHSLQCPSSHNRTTDIRDTESTRHQNDQRKINNRKE